MKKKEDLRSKETGEEVSDDTTDTVDSIDIKRIVNTQDILELGTVVASSSTDNTKDNSGPGWDETRSRSNGNETSNNTGAETDGGPLLLESVVKKTPGDTSNGSGQVGHNGGHDSAEVSTQGRTGVESEPSDPEENGTNDNVGDVVRAVVELVSTVTTTLAEHQGVGESSGTGGNVHGSTTSKVETSELEHPTGWVPGPAGNGVVDDGGPDEHEDDARKHAATLSNSANSKSNTV